MRHPRITKEMRDLLIPLNKTEFTFLESNILDNGIREPLLTWNGILIDGHHRLKIAKKHKLPYKIKELSFDDAMDAKAFMTKNQLGKRNLNLFSKASLLIKTHQPLLARLAKENQRNGVSRKSGKVIDSDKELAKILGCSKDLIWRIKKINKLADNEILRKLNEGHISINTAFLALRRIDFDRELETKPLPEGKWSIFYADPAWDHRAGPVYMDPDYPTMSIDELCQLRIKPMTTSRSVLFMWTTNVHLEQAFKVMNAWSFRYSGSNFVWKKTGQANRGYYNNSIHEILLIGKKRASAPLNPERSSSIITAKKSAHSRKPEKFRKIIDGLYPKGKRIELFARRKVKGWDAWGNEV